MFENGAPSTKPCRHAHEHDASIVHHRNESGIQNQQRSLRIQTLRIKNPAYSSPPGFSERPCLSFRYYLLFADSRVCEACLDFNRTEPRLLTLLRACNLLTLPRACNFTSQLQSSCCRAGFLGIHSRNPDYWGVIPLASVEDPGFTRCGLRPISIARFERPYRDFGVSIGRFGDGDCGLAIADFRASRSSRDRDETVSRDERYPGRLMTPGSGIRCREKRRWIVQ